MDGKEKDRERLNEQENAMVREEREMEGRTKKDGMKKEKRRGDKRRAREREREENGSGEGIKNTPLSRRAIFHIPVPPPLPSLKRGMIV